MTLRSGNWVPGLKRRANVGNRPNASERIGQIEFLERRQLLSGTFLITSYGATTSSSDNSAAILAAFTAANNAGGGTVEVPAGTFLSQPMSTAYSNVTLNIAAGGILREVAQSTYVNAVTKFFTFKNDSNVGITGPGEIDGQGATWWSLATRPAMISFSHSTGVTISDLTVVNSPKEFFTFTATNNVVADHVTISAPSTSPNTDGIDPAGSNYTIENCVISTGDDNIAIKAASVFCGNITVQDCSFGYGHGMSIGGQTTDGVNGVNVSNCTFVGTTYGIRLKANQGNGGLVQNCTYDDLTMTNVGTPIEITSWYSTTPVPGGTANATTPVWNNITISNLKAWGATHAGDIYGMPWEPVGLVTLWNVHIAAKTGFDIYYASEVHFWRDTTIVASHGKAIDLWDSKIVGITRRMFP
jgi:polygalacturonase